MYQMDLRKLKTFVDKLGSGAQEGYDESQGSAWGNNGRKKQRSQRFSFTDWTNGLESVHATTGSWNRTATVHTYYDTKWSGVAKGGGVGRWRRRTRKRNRKKRKWPDSRRGYLSCWIIGYHMPVCNITLTTMRPVFFPCFPLEVYWHWWITSCGDHMDNTVAQPMPPPAMSRPVTDQVSKIVG
jgi:hypothetical protein